MKTSVALCTYNGAKFLQQQLQSIYEQTHAVNEIIVCDDGSTDDTLQLLRAFQEQHPQVVQIHQNQQNLGGRKNFEKCFSLCTGDVIFFCDQDDVWHRDKVRKTVACFEEDKHCWALATDAQLIGETGEDLQKSFWESFNFLTSDTQPPVSSGLYDFVLRHHNIVAGAVLAVKKEAKPLIYPFHFPSNIWHDEWITIVLSCNGRLKLMEDKLVNYRIHGSQQAGVGKDSADLAGWTAKLKSEEALKGDPEFYLSHAWYTHQKVKELQIASPALKLDEIEKSLQLRLKDAKKNFLKQHHFLYRKARLMKWYKNSRFDTNLREVMAL